MTFQTKKQLRKALAAQERRADGIKWAIMMAGFTLDETTYAHCPYIKDALSPKALRLKVEQAEAKTRRETLEKVIEALKLTEYGYREPGAYAFFIPGTSDTRPGHERLWDDLQTALKVRAERKAQDEADASEKKVAGLTKKAPEYAAVIANISDIANLSGQLLADTIPADEARASAGVATPKKKPAAKKPKETKK